MRGGGEEPALRFPSICCRFRINRIFIKAFFSLGRNKKEIKDCKQSRFVAGGGVLAGIGRLSEGISSEDERCREAVPVSSRLVFRLSRSAKL